MSIESPDRLGVYLTLEGGEMVGKNVQAYLLVAVLEAFNDYCANFNIPVRIPILLVCEPGAVLYSSIERDIDLEWQRNNLKLRERLKMQVATPDEYLEGYMQARKVLIDNCIVPFLDENIGGVIISVRDITSSLVYQGLVGGVSLEYINQLQTEMIHDVVADWVFILDIAIEEFTERGRIIASVGRGTEAGEASLDTWDSKKLEFHKAIYEAYREIAKMSSISERVLINGQGSIIEVLARVVWEFERRICGAEESDIGSKMIRKVLREAGFNLGDLTRFAVQVYEDNPNLLDEMKEIISGYTRYLKG